MHACICSDSKSALQGLINPPFTQHLHFDIINLHQELTVNFVQIIFLWIPGHSGIIGNERADHFAKTALALPNITNIPIDHQTIRSSIHHFTKLHWQAIWATGTSRTQMHEIKPNIGIWTSSFRRNRKEEKALLKLRIGHTYLNHSFIYAREERPKCLPCNNFLTVLVHIDI